MAESKLCPQIGVLLINKKRVEASLREKKRDGAMVVVAADVLLQFAYALTVNDERDVENELLLCSGSVGVVTQRRTQGVFHSSVRHFDSGFVEEFQEWTLYKRSS